MIPFAVLLLLIASPSLGAMTYGEQVVERTLDNGFEMILLEDHKAPVAVIQVWYRVGARNELPGTTGLSHMLEHMMFKGTTKNGPGEYSRIISRNGGDENAFTSDDGTTYYAKIASDRIDVELELEADRMRNLILNEELFEPERKVVMEERRMRVDDQPISYLFETLSALTFLEHPYRQPVIGWGSDIEGWRLADLQRQYDQYYQPNNAFLVAVGDFDAKELGDRAAALFGPIPRGADAPEVRAHEQQPRGAARVTVRRPAKLPFIAVNYRVPNLNHPDSSALEVLEVVLSAGKSSRLYRDLVEEGRLALDAGASYSRTAIDDKTFTLTAQAQPEITPERLEAALLSQVDTVQKAPPTAEELARAKAQIESSFIFSQDSMFYRALILGTYELSGNWRKADDYLPGIRKVSAEDVQRVAQTWLTEKNRTTGTLLPAAPSAPPQAAESAEAEAK
ncbi:MAG: pitrilysin family protein [Candidatus Binatia bacterium]|nr:pitrilysin family protein [Candidatus Binatia bacterium]